MATDSSSGTLPSSSRFTIDSSSSIARSKGMVATSVSEVAAILDPGNAVVPDRACRRCSAPHQSGDMSRRRSGEAPQVIPAFEHGYHPSGGGAAGDLHDPAGGPGEVRLQQVEVRQRIALMGVEPRGNDDEVRTE